MRSVSLIFVDNNIILDYFWTLFYTVAFILYLLGLRRCFKHPVDGYSIEPKSVYIGCGVLLFSYVLRNITYLVMSRGDFFISIANPEDTSAATFVFLYKDVFEFFRSSGIMLITIGMLLHQTRMRNTYH